MNVCMCAMLCVHICIWSRREQRGEFGEMTMVLLMQSRWAKQDSGVIESSRYPLEGF